MSKTIGSFDCRFCGTRLEHEFVDLGMSPLCESYVSEENYSKMEPFFPLKAFVCHECYLVQLDSFVPPEEIFTEYAYFSSFADSWVEHARRYCHDMTGRFGLGEESTVVEVASNDGYLLQHFVKLGVPCYGIEPAANCAVAAEERGVPTEVRFFGRETASELAAAGRQADLVLGKNVLAQVPDLNDFIAGLRIIMKPDAVMTIEFPHLLRTIEGRQFDQVYHEHYCYFSLLAAERIFAHHGITLFDVEEFPTHGGSLRIYGHRADGTQRAPTERLAQMREIEREAGLGRIETYASFAETVRALKREILTFLIAASRGGKTVAAYGAPGKGNTLLNYCGIKTDMISFTVDRNPYKQGRYLPGSRLPIHHPDHLTAMQPDFVVIMPWNFKDEIVAQLSPDLAAWGGRFVVFVPEVEVFAPDARASRAHVIAAE